MYIGVQGQDGTNQFTLVVWDLLFTPDRDEDIVLEGETGVVYDVSNNLNDGASDITYDNMRTLGVSIMLSCHNILTHSFIQLGLEHITHVQ